jgi:prephenate dehydratase
VRCGTVAHLDFAGNLKDANVQEALRRLEYDCIELNVFGNYKEYR